MMALGAIAIDSKGTIFHHDFSSYGFASFDGDNFEVFE
jgi:hypothetical protein